MKILIWPVLPLFYYAVIPEYSAIFRDGKGDNMRLSFLTASAMLTTAVSSAAAGNGVSFEMLSVGASFFLWAGIPVCDAPTLFRSPPFSPWRPGKFEQPNPGSVEMDLRIFLVAAIHARSLAKLTGLSDREAEFWQATISVWFFREMAKLSAKVARGKASPAERESFGTALVGFLFVCELRSTFVLQAATKIFLNTSSSWTPGMTSMGMWYLVDYVVNLSEQKRILRLWARHWLRKLYGSSDAGGYTDDIYPILFPVMIFCAFLASVGVGPDDPIEVGRDTTENGAKGNAANEDGGSGGNEKSGVDAEVDLLCTILPMATDYFEGFTKRRELLRELDFLSCKDLACFPPRESLPLDAVDIAPFRGSGTNIGRLNAVAKRCSRECIAAILGFFSLCCMFRRLIDGDDGPSGRAKKGKK